jgi:hypothetical protein
MHKVGIRKEETLLKSKLVQAFVRRLPNYVFIRHEDVRRSGIPDASVTGDNMTSWMEVKHATPSFEWKGVQHDTMMRLSAEGWAYYVVYWEYNGRKKTLIVHPNDIATLDTQFQVEGFDHDWVVDFFHTVHRS